MTIAVIIGRHPSGGALPHEGQCSLEGHTDALLQDAVAVLALDLEERHSLRGIRVVGSDPEFLANVGAGMLLIVETQVGCVEVDTSHRVAVVGTMPGIAVEVGERSDPGAELVHLLRPYEVLKFQPLEACPVHARYLHVSPVRLPPV